jgi:hypothetical protein
MTYPTFAVGEILTAADMNAVGLWLVKTQTIGSGVSSVTVTDAFSSDFDAYKITWTGGNGSTGNEIGFQLGATTSNYYGFLTYGVYSSGTVFGAQDNNTSRFRYVGGADGSYCSLNVDVFQPYLSRITLVSASGNYGSSAFGNYSGRLADTNSYTSFTLVPGDGTLTGGTIRVYGIRN